MLGSARFGAIHETMKTTFSLFVIAGRLVAGFVHRASAQNAQTKSDLLAAYVKIADALAADHLAMAKSAASVLSDRADSNDHLAWTGQVAGSLLIN